MRSAALTFSYHRNAFLACVSVAEASFLCKGLDGIQGFHAFNERKLLLADCLNRTWRLNFKSLRKDVCRCAVCSNRHIDFVLCDVGRLAILRRLVRSALLVTNQDQL